MRFRHHVDDRAVLNVAALANLDPVHVAANYDAHPHAALVADFDVTDDVR